MTNKSATTLLDRICGRARAFAKPASPQAVFDHAVRDKQTKYDELKRAVAGVLYMRNKLEGELRERRAEIARIHEDARSAIRAGDDHTSLSLISQKQILMSELSRVEHELHRPERPGTRTER